MNKTWISVCASWAHTVLFLYRFYAPGDNDLLCNTTQIECLIKGWSGFCERRIAEYTIDALTFVNSLIVPQRYAGPC